MTLIKREEDNKKKDRDIEEVYPPGLPRRSASAIHLRPKPDHRPSEWIGTCSMARLSREKEGWIVKVPPSSLQKKTKKREKDFVTQSLLDKNETMLNIEK